MLTYSYSYALTMYHCRPISHASAKFSLQHVRPAGKPRKQWPTISLHAPRTPYTARSTSVPLVTRAAPSPRCSTKKTHFDLSSTTSTPQDASGRSTEHWITRSLMTTTRHDPIPLHPPLCLPGVTTQLTSSPTGSSGRRATRATILDQTPDPQERRPAQPPGSTPPLPLASEAVEIETHTSARAGSRSERTDLFPSLSLSSLYPPPLPSLRYTTCIYYYTRLRSTTHPPTHDSSPACLYQSCGSSRCTYCLP